MKTGASDIIHKPLNSGQVSDGIRQALQDSGRRTHDICGGSLPAAAPESILMSERLFLAIPGDRIRSAAGRA